MEKETNIGQKFLQSHLYLDEKTFFVSTAMRSSSAELNPTPYYETLSWELDDKNQKIKGSMVQHDTEKDYPQDAITIHYKIISQLLRENKYTFDNQ